MAGTDAYIHAVALPLGGASVTQGSYNYITNRTLKMYCYVRKTSKLVDIDNATVKITLRSGTSGTATYTASVGTITNTKWYHESWGSWDEAEGRKLIAFNITVPNTVVSFKEILKFTLTVGAGNRITEEKDFAFSSIYASTAGSESNDNYFTGSVHNKTYRFQNYYNSAPAFELNGVDSDNNYTDYNYYGNKIAIKVKARTEYKVLNWDMNNLIHKYKFFYSIDNVNYSLLGEATKNTSTSNDNVFIYSIPLEKQNQTIYIKIQQFSNSQYSNGNTDYAVLSSEASISPFPTPTFTVTPGDNLLIRPYQYTSFSTNTNKFTYNTTISGNFSLTLGSTVSNCASYLTIGEVEIGGFSVTLNTNTISSGSASYTPSFSNTSSKKDLLDRTLYISITNKLGVSYVINYTLNAKYFKDYEPLYIKTGAFSIINDNTQGYSGNIINPNESVKININKNYIFNPRTNASLTSTDTLKIKVRKRLESLEGSETGSLILLQDWATTSPIFFTYKNLSGRSDNNSLDKTRFCYFYLNARLSNNTNSESATYKISTPAQLGRIASINATATIVNSSLVYTFIDNGGDRNESYNYEYFYSKNGGVTNLSRTGKERMVITLTLIKKDNTSITFPSFELKVSDDLPLNYLRKMLRENQELSFGLSEYIGVIDAKEYKSGTAVLNYYYSLSGEDIYISTTITNIKIKQPSPLLSPRKGRVGINGAPGSNTVLRIQPGFTGEFDSSGNPIVADRVQFWNSAGTRYFQIRLDNDDGTAPLLSFGRQTADGEWQWISFKSFPGDDAGWHSQ